MPLFSNDTLYPKNHDTIDIYLDQKGRLSDTYYDSIRSHQIHEDSIFYKKVRKYDLGNQLMHMISANNPVEIANQQKKDYSETVNRFLPFEGKTIRSILFNQLQIFGQSVIDSSQALNSKFENLVNELHINSQKEILSNKLLIKPGDTINPLSLADNERLYREMPNIQDARIMIKEIGNSGDSVDVIVITKDVLPLGFGFELSGVQSGNAGIWNKNVMGFGHELYSNLLWDYSKSPNYGYNLQYRINNIGKTFISADASYESHWGEGAYRINLNRNFFTPQIKYAGGAGFAKINTLKDIQLPDTLYNNFAIGYYYYDFWLGRAIKLNSKFKNRVRNNIALAGRVIRYDFFKLPVTESLLHDYYTRTLFLGSISMSRQAFIQSRLINGFGKPEDIPYGLLLSVTAGYEINEFNSRPYLGFSFATGSYLDNLGFYNQKIEFGSFFNKGIEQGVISLTGKYFTRLLNPIGRYNYRVFVKFNYKAGLKRFPDEHIELTNSDGIRGLTSDSLRGDQRIYLNIENVCYSPHRILGFRFVYFVFLDAGIITNKSEYILKNMVYSGFGVGVRIRNENLVFNTLQIRLAYYPILPLNPGVKYVNVAGLGDSNHETFANTKPDVVSY